MFYDTWQGLLRVVVVGTLGYVSLLALLRISGKRTLSKMNAFDLIVTMALGSTLATILLSKDVALAEGVAAFSLLIGLQYIVTWCSVRSRRVEGWIKAAPSLLFYKGNFLHGTLRSQRVTEAEVRAAVRKHGISDFEDVGAVVLETDGTLTVIKQVGGAQIQSLANVSLPSEVESPPGAPQS